MSRIPQMLQMQAFDYFWRYIYSVCVLVSTCALYIIWSFVSCAELDFCDVATDWFKDLCLFQRINV